MAQLKDRGSVLAKLSMLDTVLFHLATPYRAAEGNLAGQEQLGVLAQQVAAPFPWLVQRLQDPTCATNPACLGADMLSVNYAGLSVVAIAAIKEQQTEIQRHAQVIDQFEKRQTGWAWKGTLLADRVEAQSAKLAQLEADQAKFRELEAQRIKAQQVTSDKVQSGETEVFLPLGGVVNLFAAQPGAQYSLQAMGEDGSYLSAIVLYSPAGLRVVPLASQGIEAVANGASVALMAPSKKVRANWLRSS